MSKNTKIEKAKQTTTDDERLLVAENQIELLHEQIELLHEQIEFWRKLVESLNLELHDKEQQLQAIEQELNYTNKELCSALMFERVNLAEAKELSKTILKNNKSASQSLADVLSAIYGSQVQPEELEQIDNTSMPLKTADANVIINNLRQIRANSKAIKAQFNELGSQFVMLQATSKVFSQKIAELIAESREIKNVNNTCKNTFIELLPPPVQNIVILAFLTNIKQVIELKFEETKKAKKCLIKE